MRVCILHHQEQDVKLLHDALAERHIILSKCIWRDDIILNALSLWDCDALIVYKEKIPTLKSIREIRQIHKNLPIIILANTDSDETKRECLLNGADSFLCTSAQIDDIIKELKIIGFTKNASIENKFLQAFDVGLDLERHIVKRSEKYITLRNKEFCLLEFFITNKEKVLTRDMILEFVWDRNGTFASNTVDVHVNRLRRKLDDPFKEKLIHTIHCIGYIFEKRDAN